MGQFRGPGAIEFIHGLIHNYGELVVKLHGFLNVSTLRHSHASNTAPIRRWVATHSIHLRPEGSTYNSDQRRCNLGGATELHRVSPWHAAIPH